MENCQWLEACRPLWSGLMGSSSLPEVALVCRTANWERFGGREERGSGAEGAEAGSVSAAPLAEAELSFAT